MALVLNEEQQMLQQSARDFLDSQAPVSHLRNLRDSGNPTGYSVDAWNSMCELGWPAIVVPEKFDGLGFGFAGLGVLLQETGRTLTPSPLNSSAMMAVAALLEGASESQQQTLLPDIASGVKVVVPACDEQSRHAPAQVATTATREDGDAAGSYCLNGQKVSVIDGMGADFFLVSARTSGAVDEAAGISLFLVPAEAPGLSREPREALDIGVMANLALKDVVVSDDARIGDEGSGLAILEHSLDAGRIGQSAELLGLAIEAFERTIGYLKERKQFGLPIGSFQALQHRAAIVFGELEFCKSMVLDALQQLDRHLLPDNGQSDDPQDSLALIASRTKAKLSEVAMLVTAEAIQMHGGIGMTDDFEIGFFYKRARILETLLGDRHYHLDRFAAQRGY